MEPRKGLGIIVNNYSRIVGVCFGNLSKTLFESLIKFNFPILVIESKDTLSDKTK